MVVFCNIKMFLLNLTSETLGWTFLTKICALQIYLFIKIVLIIYYTIYNPIVAIHCLFLPPDSISFLLPLG